MLNSERKKIHVLRNKKNKYSNSCPRKNNSERKKTEGRHCYSVR